MHVEQSKSCPGMQPPWSPLLRQTKRPPSLVDRARAAVCRTHEKELKAVAVRFEADAMEQAGEGGAALQEPHVQAAIRVSSRQSIEASALTY